MGAVESVVLGFDRGTAVKAKKEPLTCWRTATAKGRIDLSKQIRRSVLILPQVRRK